MSIGRGLGALISPTFSKKKPSADDTSGTQRIWMVPVSEIKPDPRQPRRNFKPEELKELAESIRQHGVLQPLLVAEKADGGYEIIAGERRWRASQLAGLATLPVIVKEMAEGQKLEVALIENIQREDLNPLEEAFAFKRLIEEFGLTQQQVAEKVGKITSGQARALLSITDKAQQLEVLASMLGEKITVRELEREAQKRNEGKQ